MAIVLVQSVPKDIKGVNNTTLAFPSPVTAGNFLHIAIVTFQVAGGTTITTPSDTLAHSYQPVEAQQNNGVNQVHLRSWYVPNCSAGSNTVTADISGTDTGEITMIISEWSGIEDSSPLSGTPLLAGPVSTTTPSTGNITAADPDCLLIGVLNTSGVATTITPTGTGWATVQEYEGTNSSVTLSVTFKIQTAAVAEAATWTISPADGYQGSFVTQCALKLAAYTFVRPGELRGAEWREFDKLAWRIPAERMKMRSDHIVPLSEQAGAVVRALSSVTFTRPLSISRPARRPHIRAHHHHGSAVYGLPERKDDRSRISCHGPHAAR